MRKMPIHWKKKNADYRMCTSLYELAAKCGSEFKSQKMTETKKLVTEIEEQLRKRSLRSPEEKSGTGIGKAGNGAETQKQNGLTD